ncbi:hypothetical protein GCM10010405_42380 [Streptomyces macrosporus]|uniref:Uncharacterized protein n=1 Tax=Streptomyces macrosporus TaxID=44032 RepID=A0ABN3KAB1_9ACTN
MVALERHLRTLIENMEAMLGVRFLATEYGTDPRHGGRIDSLGADENGSPAIVEYKRSQRERNQSARSPLDLKRWAGPGGRWRRCRLSPHQACCGSLASLFPRG